MSQPRQLTRGDTELGPVRFCRRCNEWWPDDAEFWEVSARAGATEVTHGRPYTRQHDVRRCRACGSAKRHPRSIVTRRYRRDLRRSLTSKNPGWCSACLAVKTTERLCHGCAGRTVGPLTVDRLQTYGFAPRPVELVA